MDGSRFDQTSEAAGWRAEPVVVEGHHRPSSHRKRDHRTRSLWIYTGVGVFMLVALAYGVDLVASLGRVPRGTEVAGVEVGGMRHTDAEEKLRRELGPRVDDEVALRAGAVSTSLDPKAVGLSVDWQATLDRGGEQPLNPFTRLTSIFATHEVGIASVIPDQRLTSYLERLAAQADFGPREGAIWFDRDQVRSVIPLDGQKVQIEKSRDAVLEHWLDENGVDLAVVFTPTETRSEQVRNLIRTVAEPAVSRDVTLVASTPLPDGREPPVVSIIPPPPPVEPGRQAPPDPKPLVVVDPQGPQAVPRPFPRERIGEYLTFVRRGGSLEPKFDAEAAKGILEPQLQATEQVGRDAAFSFAGDTATVVPAVRGRTVEWGPVLAALPDQMRDTSGPRLVPVGYKAREPELTTDAATRAGITSRVGEYTIAVGADGGGEAMLSKLNGTFIPGGGSFSLASATGTRSGSRSADAVASALFNAAYEAGTQGLTRTQRPAADTAFPAGRDATAGADVAFRNAQKSGLVIEAYGTGSSVTVRLWGSREYQVATSTTPRSDVRSVAPQVSTAEGCRPSPGEEGYTVSVTRTVRRGTEAVSTDTFRSTYAPEPGVTCRAAPPTSTPGATTSPAVPAPPPPPVIVIPGLPPIPLPVPPPPR